MQQSSDLPGWLGIEAPRYTSYPPANHFSAEVDASLHGQWLDNVKESTSLSVYVHIPFCRQLCWFCGCHTRMTSRYTPIAGYVQALLTEIELIGKRLNGRGRLVTTHFGGGSPGLLLREDLSSILSAISGIGVLQRSGELAIELDPRTTTAEQVDMYARAGVNRVSIGIQDFDKKVQKAVNRIQPYAEVAALISRLRQTGITAINTDLIYGLPHQNRDSFRHTLEQVAMLSPSRISLFSFAYMPHLKKHQRLIDAAALPSDAEKLELYVMAQQYLESCGYVSIGIDHFAQQDDPLAIAAEKRLLRRNFQGYVTDTANVLIGFGCSAISQFPEGYAQNHVAEAAYGEALRSGHLPVARGWATRPEDILRKQIIDALMCHLSIDLSQLRARYGLPEYYFGRELAELARPEYRDILVMDGEQLRLETPYRMAIRAVASVFDQYRPMAGRYSKVA